MAADQHLGTYVFTRYRCLHRSGISLVAADQGRCECSCSLGRYQRREGFRKIQGKLAGKIVLYGEMREVKPIDKALFNHLEDDDLKKLADYPLVKREGDGFQQFLK